MVGGGMDKGDDSELMIVGDDGTGLRQRKSWTIPVQESGEELGKEADGIQAEGGDDARSHDSDLLHEELGAPVPERGVLGPRETACGVVASLSPT